MVVVTPIKTKKRHLLAGLAGLLVVAVTGVTLFKAQVARSAIASDDQLNASLILPAYNSASQGSDTFLEISQPGANNTLDAPQTWIKVYLDPNKVDDATIGIYAGGYANGVDSEGYKFRGLNGAFADSNASRFEFYLGRDQQFTDSNNVKFWDERPCTTRSTYKDSGAMPANGWWKIDVARFKNYTCGSGSGSAWSPTKKTGKYVIFIKAIWIVSPNPISDGRLNAFKVAAAYATASGRPLTGYWSDYGTATKASNPALAGYSVQDRRSADGTQGDYTFKFAPDCRIAKNTLDPDQRYIHWKDVDYPGYYSGQPAPYFDVIEVSPSGQRRTMTELHVDKNTTINGKLAFGQDVHAALPFRGKGGYSYEWQWHNVTRVDGVTFWLPYDDYPALVGCGSFQHAIKLYGGVGGLSGTSTVDFNAPGNAVLNFLIDESITGSAAAPDTTSHAVMTNISGTPYANVFQPPGAISISDNGYRQGSARVEWVLDGMGASSPYTSQRWLQFSYKTVNEAEDGAKYCFTADMSPGSSSNDGAITSNRICVTIDNTLKPYLKTNEGDVHAGGDCSIPSIGHNSRIDGIPIGADTYFGTSGSYIVSSGGPIYNFGSGGNTDSTRLTMSNYGAICRPTLADMKASLYNSDQPLTTIDASGTYNLGNVPAGQRTLIKFASDGTIIGQSKAPVTVLSETGTITIKGSPGTPVGADTSYAAAKDKLPVVGIVANNIKIESGVYQLNALLYAVGNIDTCSDGSVNSSTCRSVLLLDGFAMANDFSFKRTSSGYSGYQRSEELTFNAAYYISPPPLFSQVSGAVKYEGERGPLY